MTFAEKARKEHPELCDGLLGYPTHCCPHHESFGYEEFSGTDRCAKLSCRECWNREIPGEKPNDLSDQQRIASYLWTRYVSFQEAGFDKAQAFDLTRVEYESMLEESYKSKP